MILKRAKYPSYLMGGIADQENPRDYVRNARVHIGARVAIIEDVASFFPSVSVEVVFDIWRHLFRFPAEVSKMLARLTTCKGALPQGAKTSSYLANLVFWAIEPRVVRQLWSMGFEYTRYIDDITISSKTNKSSQQIGRALSLLASMLSRYGLTFKRSKHTLNFAGQHMEVTGLIVSETCIGLPRNKRSNARALVHQCELKARNGDSEVLSAMMPRAWSHVGNCARLHPAKGEILKARLRAISARSQVSTGA